MPSMFICYRREETAGHAGRLCDVLKEHFGASSVFMDVTGIRPGEDFVNVLENAIGSCEVVIVLIGRRWLTSAALDGVRRLDDPADYVRLEIETALTRNLRVIPVLVEGVAMPHPGDLPLSLSDLARRQAHEVRDSRWNDDILSLVDTLSQQGPRAVAERPKVLREQRSCFYFTPEELTALHDGSTKWRFKESVQKKVAKGPGTFQLTSNSVRFVCDHDSFTVDLNDVFEVRSHRSFFSNKKGWFETEEIGQWALCLGFYHGSDTRAVVLWGPENDSFASGWSGGWEELVTKAIAKRKGSRRKPS